MSYFLTRSSYLEMFDKYFTKCLCKNMFMTDGAFLTRSGTQLPALSAWIEAHSPRITPWWHCRVYAKAPRTCYRTGAGIQQTWLIENPSFSMKPHLYTSCEIRLILRWRVNSHASCINAKSIIMSASTMHTQQEQSKRSLGMAGCITDGNGPSFAIKQSAVIMKISLSVENFLKRLSFDF